MFSGDPNFPSLDQASASKLGMEARSILKSIHTEESKLVNSTNVTRSDHYYFRARHNYYKLSLLRLCAEERQVLEPVLAKFQKQIHSFTEGIDEKAKEHFTPFLESVEKLGPKAELRNKNEVLPEAQIKAAEPQVYTPKAMSADFAEELISQLSLLQLALNAELSPSSKKVLGDGVQRIIRNIRHKK